MVPITLGLGLINFNAFIDTIFAARLLDKYQAPSSINAAFRLYIFPQGMFSVAVATVLFPSLARLATRGDMDGFRRWSTSGLRQIAFLLIPASVDLRRARRADRPDRLPARRLHAVADLRRRRLPRRVRARPHVQRRDADAEPRLLLAPVGVDPDDGSRSPTSGLNAALDFAFYRFGIWGIPLSTSLVNIAGSVALMIMFRRKLGGLDIGADARLGGQDQPSPRSSSRASRTGSGGRSTTQLGQRFVAQAVSLGVALAVGAAVYLGLCKLLHVEELGALRLLRRSRTET